MTSKLFGFLAELKRRKVYHVGAAYIAASIVLSTATAELYPYLRLPEWTPGLVILLLVVGFPIALVLAWAYEVKPEETRVEEQMAGEAQSAEDLARPTVKASEGELKSIVVLPFDNMSPDPGDAYFSDGLTEEIITTLSHVHSLRVISRTSAMALKGTQKDTRAIAQELDVQFVLEGSVRKAGDKLRITAQLIDGRSDTHLWAEKYDGILQDVFAMQEQVSLSIVDALKIVLDPAEEKRLVSRPVDDLVAFECYLKAWHHIWKMTEDSLEEALEILAQGLALQPNSAELHATRAFVNCQYLNSMSKAPVTYPELLEEAQSWASKALELDPDSSMVQWSQGTVHWFSGNPSGAMTHLIRSVELNPNDAAALNFLGFQFIIGGHHLEKAREFLSRAAQVDPLNPLNAEVGPSYFAWFSGDFGRVLDLWKTWRDSEAPLQRLYTGYFHAANGKVEEAFGVFGKITRDTPKHPAAAAGAFLQHALQGETKLALDSVTEELEEAAWWDEFTPVLMADGYALIGEQEQALRWVDRAIDMGVSNAAFLGEHEPFLRRLRGNPGYEALLEKARRVTADLASQADLALGS